MLSTSIHCRTLRVACRTLSLSTLWRFEAADQEFRRFLSPHIEVCSHDMTDFVRQRLTIDTEPLNHIKRVTLAIEEDGS